MKKYIILLLLIGLFYPLKAQYIRNDGAKIMIGATSSIRSGEWSNIDASSQTNLFGNLSLTQNLVNNGVFTGTGSSSNLYFTGTSLQNIQGSNTLSLYNMYVNNSASNVSLSNSVSISNLLGLTNGNLISETAPILFTFTAQNPIETDANRIIGTATMQNRTIGMAALPTFLGISLNAGADIGSLSITRYTGNQGIITIPTGQSIASTWTFNATNNVSRDITYDWLSDLDNGLDISTLQLRNASTLAGTWATNGGTLNIPTRVYTATTLLNANWSFFDFVAPPIPPLPIPASPTGFTATAISPTQINLNWNAVTNNAVEYQIFQNGILIATLSLETTTYQVTGLTSNTLYNFTLVAINRGFGQIKISDTVFAKDWTFPEIPILLSVSTICGEGKANLQLEGSGTIFRVYDKITDGNLLLESNNGSFELPIINQDSTFYVSVVGISGKESQRIPVLVEVQPIFEAKILGENLQISCENSIQLKAQEIENATYTWYLNGTNLGINGKTITANYLGNYQVFVQKGVCSFMSEKVSIKLNQNPVAKIQEKNGIKFCQNGTLNSVSAGQNVTYEWILNNVIVGNNQSLNVTQSGIYTLLVTNSNNCQASTEIEVIVTDIPQNPILETTNTSICPNTETTISIQNPQNDVVYQWLRNGRNLNQTGNSISTSIKGTYQVRVISNENNACNSISEELKINHFEVLPMYLRVSEDKKALFVEDANNSQSEIASVEWYFEGELQPDLGSDFEIIPTENGNYFAKITNQNGCFIQTRTVYFSVPKIPIITGNEDLKNNLFKIYPNPSAGNFTIYFGTAILENIQITIFDGIGRTIYTKTLEKGNQEFKMNLQNKPSGIYLIRFNQNNSTYSKQIIIE